MKIRILLPFLAVALFIGLSQGVVEAKKDVLTKLEACRANCDARAKKCALEGTVSVANCVATKNVCYNDICGGSGSGTSGAETEAETPQAR